MTGDLLDSMWVRVKGVLVVSFDLNGFDYGLCFNDSGLSSQRVLIQLLVSILDAMPGFRTFYAITNSNHIEQFTNSSACFTYSPLLQANNSCL